MKGLAASRRALDLALMAFVGCGTTNHGDVGVETGDGSDEQVREDAVADVTGSADAFDVRDEPRAPDTADALEMLDDRIAPDVTDGSSDAADATSCPPPSSPPPTVGRSCAPSSGVDPLLCSEVYFCGGSIAMGYRWASELACDSSAYPSGFRSDMIRACEAHTAHIHDGFVDANEVTVGRFRQWVNAGMPTPAIGTNVFNGLTWTSRIADRVRGASTSDDGGDCRTSAVSGPSQCTWSPTVGPNERLPINCVSRSTALAFCWWDGKHLATEAAWEYVARNRGANVEPWGTEVFTIANPCIRGDVGAFTGQCPVESLPQAVGMHPMGDSRDPAGVHDLFGGVSELVIGEPFPYWTWSSTLACGAPIPSPVEDGAIGVGVGWAEVAILERGASWLSSRALEDVMMYSSSRMEGVADNSPRLGFRCMRWNPEPRD